MKTMFKTRPETTAALTLRDDPEYRTADDRLAELKAQRRANQAAMRNLVERSNNIASENRREKLDAAATALVAGQETPEQMTQESLAKSYDKLCSQSHVIARAIELQEAVVSDIGNRVSREICDRLRPEYIELLQAVGDAAEELSRAQAAEAEFRLPLHEAGINISGYMPPVLLRLPAIGHADDPNSLLNVYRREVAREHGTET